MATATTPKWLIRIALLALALAAVAWFFATRGDATKDVATTDSAPVATAPAESERDITAEPAPRHTSDLAPDVQQRRSQSDAQMSAASRAMVRYHCIDIDDRERVCDGDATAASNEVEALWLAQHGYPSRADMEEYPSLSVSELDARALHDPAFAVLRARRRIEDGERGTGLTQLMRLAQRGDLYALYEMSRAYRNTDIYDSGAYLRLAYTFGDRRAARELYATFPNFGIPEFDLIDKRAASLRLTMFPGLTVPPRPFE